MTMRNCAFLTGLLLALAGTTSALAYFTDAPHNEANGIGCVVCHVGDVYDNHVPSNIDDTVNNVVCLGCHGPGGTAPQHKLHSDLVINGTQNWTTQCTDCHDPHFQDNIRSWAGIDANTYLATGTVTATTHTTTPPEANYPDGKTTISYTVLSALPDWSTPSTWNSKGGHSDKETSADASRGLIFMIDYENLGDTYEIIAADNSTITLKGQLPPSSGLDFAILYGQSITSYMLDANGNGEKYIKSFSPLNSTGTDNGFVDSTTSQTPFGICQVCHPPSILYWNNNNSGNGSIVHSPDSPCSACHQHTAGFAPGAEHANFLTDGNNCTSCHTRFTKPETAHPNCYSCHPVTTLYINDSTVRAESVGNHTALASSADGHTFDAGDRLIDGSYGNVRDPGFTKVTCVICHVSKTDWKIHNTNTHPTAIIATTDNSCETCHVAGTGPFNTANEVHFNGGTGASCTLCHNPADGTLTGLASNHTVGAQSNCKTCHEAGQPKHVPPPAHSSVYEGGQNNIVEPVAIQNGCDTAACHGALPDILGKHVDRKTVTFPLGMDCQSCHATGSKLDDAVVAAAIDAGISTAASPVPPACADCHGAQTEPHGFVDHVLPAFNNYAPITVDAECIVCHAAYTAPGLAHKTSCGTCHLQVPGLRTTPNLAQFAGSTTTCKNCHTVSGVANHGDSTATVGTIHNLSSANCQSCHDTMTTGEAQLNAHMGGSGNCAICHNAADTVNGTSATNVIYRATTLIEDNPPQDPPEPAFRAAVTCEQCHAFKGDYRLHGMTVFDTHDAHNNTTYEDTPSQEPATITGTCATCHVAFASPNLAMNHIALAGTTTYAFGMNCQSCHNYSGSKLTANIDAVINAGVASISSPASCADCHGVRTDTINDTHPPTPPNDHLGVNNGYAPISPDSECTICHSDTISQIHLYDCKSCHDLNLQDLAVTPFDLTQFAGSSTSCNDCHNPVIFPAIKEHGLTPADVETQHDMFSAACLTCHDTMTDRLVLLNEHMPTGDCQSCHGVADTANGTSATTVIDAAAAPADNLRVSCEQCHALKGDYRLHGLDGASSADIHNNTAFDTTPALTCNIADCHGAMASVASGHLALAATTAYSNGMDCYSCHNYNPVVEGVSVGTLVPVNIDAAINTGKSSAGNSLATAYCADCHGGVRSADHPNVVHTAVGSGEYAPITPDAECTNCHTNDITEVHPTCETCHAASMTALITTPFNLAQFAGSTTTCTECHSGVNVPTIRKHGITAADVGNIHNMSSASCQTCHDTMSTGLAQLNEHMVTGTCLNCHGVADTANGTSATTVIDTATSATVNLAVTCEQCHRLKGDYRLHGLTVANTADVHNNTVFKDTPSQEPVTIGNCETCHAAFGGLNLAVSHFAMSSTPTYGSGMNCISCHNYTQGAVAGMTRSKVDAAIAAGVASNSSPAPVSCADCHSVQTAPHPSTPANDHLDAASKGYAPITANGECVTCHSGTISHIHSYNCATCHYTIMPYLITVPYDLTRFAGSTTACTDCHNASIFPTIKKHGLTAAEVGVKHHLSSANCQSCHDTMTTGTVQLNTHMTATGSCLGCHTAANSGSASATSVINAAIAPANNLPVTCEECHVVKGNYRLHGLTASDTTDAHNNTHNLATTPLTEVNNQGLDCKSCHGSFVISDLHTVHIALTSTTTYQTGMNCLSCHNYSQGAKLPNMTKAKVDAAIIAGATDLTPVECADCHSPLAADHGGHSQPDTFVRERTECTACHDSQNNRNYITNIHNRRAPGIGLDNCEVCHLNGGEALQDYSASGGVLIPEDMVNYAARTGGTGGDCLTCHNDSGGGTNMPFSQTDDFTGLISGQGAGSAFGNWTEVADGNGTAQWMIWNGATATSGTGPSAGTGEYVVFESSPASAACTVDPRGTYIEAENYENSIVPGSYNWSVASTVNGANNGRYLRTTTGGTSATPRGAQTDYTVVIPAAGTYQIIMRLQDGDWNNGSGDSTMWGVDGSLVGIITETTVGTWTWTGNQQAPSNQVYLSAGSHTVNLWPREKDQLTDAFILWNTSYAAPVSERNTSISIPSGITVLDPTNCGSSGDVDATNGNNLLAAGTSQSLVSNTFDASLYDSLAISFNYNMNVSDNNNAVLSVAAWNGTVWNATVIRTGSTGDVWQGSGTIDFTGYMNSGFKIRIQYLVGTGTLYQNDVAIDDIVISGDLKSVGDGSRYHPAIIHNTITDDTASCTTTCHEETNSITGTHKVVGGVDSPDCGKCHQSANGDVIQAIYNGSEGTIQTCADCHSGYTTNFTTSHTVIGNTHATMVNAEATCSTASCHTGDVQVDVHGNGSISNCDLCHVDVALNNGTLRGMALNHTVGTPSTCSQCHIGRDNDHTAEHDNALYEDTPSLENKVAFNNVSGQCDSCHSFMGFNGTGYGNISTAHVGLVIATKEITTGENNEPTGTLSCNTCHLSAKALVVAAIANGRSSNTPAPDNASCADCHGARSLPHGGHDLTHFSSNGDCNTCHTATNVVAGVHGNQCLLCHNNPLGGDVTTVIEGDSANGIDGDAREASKLPDWRNAGCLTCHAGAANTTTSLNAHHGPSKNNYYANEQCAACHVDVDSTVHAQPVFDDPPPANVDPCVNCHALFSNLSAGHIGRSVVSNNLGTPQGSEIDCMSCHGSINPVVTGAIAAGIIGPAAKCAACHGPRQDPHGGHADTDFAGSSVCTSCHTITALGITLDFHVCDDCHVGGNGAVKIGDSAGGINGDARLGAALSDYTKATCLTCHGTYMTTTTSEGAGGTNSATTYGGAHHNNTNAQAGICDTCHYDPRSGGPVVDWELTFGVSGPDPLPKRLACITCHVNETNGLKINEVAYQWAGVAEKSKINSIATVKTIHQLDSLTGQPITVNNYGICLGCHNEAQKGRRINVFHARPVATNMWANGSDGKSQGTTQIDNLQKAAGITTFKIFGDKSLYPAKNGGIGDLKTKYDKIYKENSKLADYVKNLKKNVGSPISPYNNYAVIPCGPFNDWEGQCGQVGAGSSVSIPRFVDLP